MNLDEYYDPNYRDDPSYPNYCSDPINPDYLILCNATTVTENDQDWIERYPNTFKLVLIVLSVSAILGIAWNVAVAFIIFTRRQFQTPSNFYVLNRAIADILILCPIPLVVVWWSSDSLRVGGVVCLFFSSAVQVGLVSSAVFLVLLSYDCYLSRRTGVSWRWKVLLAATVGTWVLACLSAVPIYWLEKEYWKAKGECRVSPLFHLVVPTLSLPILVFLVALPIVLSWTFLALGLRTRKFTRRPGQSSSQPNKVSGLKEVKIDKVKKLDAKVGEVKEEQISNKKRRVIISEVRKSKEARKGASKRSGDVRGMKRIEKVVDRKSTEVRESMRVEKRAVKGSNEVRDAQGVEKRAVKGSNEVRDAQGVDRSAVKGSNEIKESEKVEKKMEKRSFEVRESHEVAKESAEVKELREIEKRGERRLVEAKESNPLEKEAAKRSVEVKDSTQLEQGTLKRSSEVSDPKKTSGQPYKATTGSFEVTRSFVAALILTFTMCQAPHWIYNFYFYEFSTDFNFYLDTFLGLFLLVNQVLNPFLWLGHSRSARYEA